ncbi:uncharacterized protein LOC128722574 [Anopheles nili]|uniref:uncharacterized protein LOC128722574 n=1 Tax=Anopheles nili TaxID=185578 RepID=UPI00237C4150|nr:uncharacterized protein LOC128722574 [Anopheles nili]
MAWVYTGPNLSSLCCCNQRHLLAVIFIFTIVMGAPHSDFTSAPWQMAQEHQHQHAHHHNHPHNHPSPEDAPSAAPFPMAMFFATKNNTKVTAQRGGTALLPCTVISQSSALVSWIRRQDFQLLTVGLSTYSSDERFLVEHLRHLGHWALRIKSVRTEDEGLYECQLSVHPVQSVFVELKVVEAAAEIVGSPDLHIDEGSTLRLECKLERATENPTFVFWYHEQNMVNFDQANGFSVTPFQPPASAFGHPSPLHPYLLPHPLQDGDLDMARSSEEQGFNLLGDGDDADDDDAARLLHRSLHFGRDPPTDPYLPASASSSSLLIASLAAASLSGAPYQQHLDRVGGLSAELDDPPTPTDVDADGTRRPHLHHQHHLHHHHHHHGHHQHRNQHHSPHGAWPANYTSPLPYSHILTPAPSVLTIKEVHLRHAGNYTCAPSNARPASITVHVLQGEKPAAMQHANRSQLDDGGKQSRNGCHRQRAIAVAPLASILLLVLLCSSGHLGVSFLGSHRHR